MSWRYGRRDACLSVTLRFRVLVGQSDAAAAGQGSGPGLTADPAVARPNARGSGERECDAVERLHQAVSDKILYSYQIRRISSSRSAAPNSCIYAKGNMAYSTRVDPICSND